jgi:hypothetical protein
MTFVTTSPARVDSAPGCAMIISTAAREREPGVTCHSCEQIAGASGTFSRRILHDTETTGAASNLVRAGRRDNRRRNRYRYALRPRWGVSPLTWARWTLRNKSCATALDTGTSTNRIPLCAITRTGRATRMSRSGDNNRTDYPNDMSVAVKRS